MKWNLVVLAKFISTCKRDILPLAEHLRARVQFMNSTANYKEGGKAKN